MESKKKRPTDANQLAKLVVDIATGQVEDKETPTKNKKNKIKKKLTKPKQQ